MHVIQGGWVGQTYALATSSDAGGKKPRIRRSKQERKTMVESFVKKYQKSNNGKFPSLNLTHKETGGSFYTVREIVRDIIQENRVLAPPKESLDRHDPAGFLEQHNLISNPMEHHNVLSTLDQFHIATPILCNQHLVTNGEPISSSSLQFSGPQLNDEQVLNEPGKVTKEEKVHKEVNISHPVPKHHHGPITEEVSSSVRQPSPRRGNLMNEKIVNGSEGIEDDNGSDKPLRTSATPIAHEKHVITLQSSQKVSDAPEIHGDIDEQIVNKMEMVDKAKDAEKLYMKSADKEIFSEENVRGQDKEVLQVAKSNSSSVVEMSPDSGTVLDRDGESRELHEAARSSEDVANESEKIALKEINLDVVNVKGEEKLNEVKLTLDYEYEVKKQPQSLPEPSREDSKLSTTFSPAPHNGGESKSTLLDGTKVSSSAVQPVSEAPANARIGSNSQSKIGVKKMDRINLETWEGASKRSTKPQHNPVLEFVKAFLSAFIKLWTK